MLKSSSVPRIGLDVGLIVTDLERSLQFYRDALGLPVVAETRTSLIGRGRMLQLQHGASRIKLVQLETSPAPISDRGLASSCGCRYVTLLVADIRSVWEELQRRGVPVVQPLTQLGNGAWIGMVEDPDGVVVEFVQEPLGQAGGAG